MGDRAQRDRGHGNGHLTRLCRLLVDVRGSLSSLCQSQRADIRCSILWTSTICRWAAVDEQVMGFPNAFTHTAPGGWTRDNTNFPEPFNPSFGTFEWKGWSFANSGFWEAAESGNDFSGRSAFQNGTRTIAVADSDLWNDKANPANGIGFFNSTLRSQPISISLPITLNEQISVSFDASWRGECCDDGAGFNPNGNNQTFVVEAIYNNSIVQPVLGGNRRHSATQWGNQVTIRPMPPIHSSNRTRRTSWW